VIRIYILTTIMTKTLPSSCHEFKTSLRRYPLSHVMGTETATSIRKPIVCANLVFNTLKYLLFKGKGEKKTEEV